MPINSHGNMAHVLLVVNVHAVYVSSGPSESVFQKICTLVYMGLQEPTSPQVYLPARNFKHNPPYHCLLPCLYRNGGNTSEHRVSIIMQNTLTVHGDERKTRQNYFL
jgi:hypothetical protein